jgi:hypothetical protein
MFRMASCVNSAVGVLELVTLSGRPGGRHIFVNSIALEGRGSEEW